MGFMGFLFINYQEGRFECTKRVHVEDAETKEIKQLFKKHQMVSSDLEIRGEGINYMLDGITYYLKEPAKFAEINKQIDLILK
jgi:hypothetical protein